MDSNSHADKKVIQERLGLRSIRRRSVMCEAYDPEKDQDDEEPDEVFPKSLDERMRIEDHLKEIFFFRALDEHDKGKVVDAMERRDVEKGEEIIKEGDEEGNSFYVIDRGHFEAYVNGVEGPVTTYKDTGYFGELALLHNQPRSATVRAVTKGSIWAISRTTFKRLVIKRSFEKRKKYMLLLSNVAELQPLTDYERLQVADALQPVQLLEGMTLFKEGDEGDGMFFVESGRLSVTQISPTTGQSEVVNEIRPGEYVGELALINDEKRAATVTAMEDSVLAFLQRQAFERLLGPCLDILKGKGKTYRHSV